MSAARSARARRGLSSAAIPAGATTVAAPVMKPCARKSRRLTGFLCDSCFSGSLRPSARLRRDLMINMSMSLLLNQDRGVAECRTARGYSHIQCACTTASPTRTELNDERVKLTTHLSLVRLCGDRADGARHERIDDWQTISGRCQA